LLLLALAVAAAALFFADVIPGGAMTNTAIIETTFVTRNGEVYGMGLSLAGPFAGRAFPRQAPTT